LLIAKNKNNSKIYNKKAWPLSTKITKMRISRQKQEKIKEAILQLLFHTSPRALFTADIARELARDEEFTKRLLQELREKGLVVSVNMSADGKLYNRRLRWRLSSAAYDAYKKLQTT